MNAPNPQSKLKQSVMRHGSHRSRAHDSAQEMPEEQPQRIPDHPLICGEAPELITEQEKLLELVDSLRAGGVFAYDTEFIGELTYFPRLCLIQVATPDRVALIDPMLGLDDKPFWELVTDPGVLKIVHAGLQDLEPAYRLVGRPPANVFDTQITSGFIRLPYPLALGKLALELLNIQMPKGMTFTHWDNRPLSARQLRYAADDVRYLPAMHAAITARLGDSGHMGWAAEECAGLCDESNYTQDARTRFMRVKDAPKLKPRSLAVLRELVVVRDEAARQHDLPPRALMKDEVLADLSREPVTSVEKLGRVRGLPKPVEQQYGRQIVEATQRALALPREEWPVITIHEETPVQRYAINSLAGLVDAHCMARSIDPTLVCNRQGVADFYLKTTRGKSTERCQLGKGWRKELMGELLGGFLGGQAGMKFKWGPDGLVVESGGL